MVTVRVKTGTRRVLEPEFVSVQPFTAAYITWSQVDCEHCWVSPIRQTGCMQMRMHQIEIDLPAIQENVSFSHDFSNVQEAVGDTAMLITVLWHCFVSYGGQILQDVDT